MRSFAFIFLLLFSDVVLAQSLSQDFYFLFTYQNQVNRLFVERSVTSVFLDDVGLLEVDVAHINSIIAGVGSPATSSILAALDGHVVFSSLPSNVTIISTSYFVEGNQIRFSVEFMLDVPSGCCGGLEHLQRMNVLLESLLFVTCMVFGSLLFVHFGRFMMW